MTIFQISRLIQKNVTTCPGHQGVEGGVQHVVVLEETVTCWVDVGHFVDLVEPAFAGSCLCRRLVLQGPEASDPRFPVSSGCRLFTTGACLISGRLERGDGEGSVSLSRSDTVLVTSGEWLFLWVIALVSRVILKDSGLRGQCGH